VVYNDDDDDDDDDDDGRITRISNMWAKTLTVANTLWWLSTGFLKKKTQLDKAIASSFFSHILSYVVFFIYRLPFSE